MQKQCEDSGVAATVLKNAFLNCSLADLASDFKTANEWRKSGRCHHHTKRPRQLPDHWLAPPKTIASAAFKNLLQMRVNIDASFDSCKALAHPQKDKAIGQIL